MINKINWSDAIFFFDIDDTLIETAKNSVVATEGILNVLKTELGEEKAKRISDKFIYIFNTLANQHWTSEGNDHKEYNMIMKKINKLQKPIIEKFGSIRKWSREVFLKIAGEDLNISLDPELIYKAVDSYWEMVSEKSIPIKGVMDLFNDIKSHNRPIFLVTGSDARLKLNTQGYFEYDPAYSERSKAKRIEVLRANGLFFNRFSIGDPEDKPHLDFFEKAVRIAEEDLGHKIDPKSSLMFGDSYKADLQVPKEKMGFGLVVLIKKDQEKTKEEGEGYISTGNIYNVADYLA